MPELKEKFHLDLTDKEAILVNTLYAMMVAMSNGSQSTVNRTLAGLKGVVMLMTDEEQIALNGKIAKLTKGLDPEISKQCGIERAMPFTELRRRYAREDWNDGLNNRGNT